MATSSQKNLLDYRSLSEYTGISESVLRKYLSVARSNREAGDDNRSDIPEPDITIGSSPAWDQRTIDRWLAGRPGRGVGGGPKPRHRASS
jgi:predicted DNA-binding transcriptional regulator AlpA